MRKPKDWVWPLLFLMTATICSWQIWAKHQLATEMDGAGERAQLSETVAATRTYELSLVGKPLVWPESLSLLGEGELLKAPTGHRRLLIAVSEVSCTTCRDEQTAFVLDMAKKYGDDSVIFVVHAAHPRYGRAYLRLNGIHNPIHYDEEGRFFQNNGLTDSPVLMVINDHGEVVAAHFPLPDKPWWSTPFHKFANHYLADAIL